MPTYTILPSLSANKVLTASYMNLLNDDLRIIGTHGHSGCVGEGASLVNSGSAASPFVYRQEAICYIAPSQTNWSTSTQGATAIFGAVISKLAGVAASIKFPVFLYQGTYRLDVMFHNNSGSTRILLDGASFASLLGTGAAESTVCSIHNISYSSTASKVLEFNSDTTSGAFSLNAFKIKRTGS